MQEITDQELAIQEVSTSLNSPDGNRQEKQSAKIFQLNEPFQQEHERAHLPQE
jgi:hypothetical protein